MIRWQIEINMLCSLYFFHFHFYHNRFVSIPVLLIVHCNKGRFVYRFELRLSHQPEYIPSFIRIGMSISKRILIKGSNIAYGNLDNTKSNVDSNCTQVDQCKDDEEFDSILFHLIPQLVGSYLLYFIAQHAAVSNLEIQSQAALYSMFYVMLIYVAPFHHLDSLCIFWGIIQSMILHPTQPLRVLKVAIKGSLSIGCLLVASLLATYTTHWHTQDYDVVGNIRPRSWVTQSQAIVYEAIFRVILLVTIYETMLLSKRICQCSDALRHETDCIRASGVWGASPFIVGFAISIVFYCTATSSGGSVDIIRAFGPAIKSNDWTGILNAFIGQLSGQVLVGVVYLVRHRVTQIINVSSVSSS